MVPSTLQITRLRPALLWVPWLGLAVQILISSEPINAACALLAALSGWLLLLDSFVDERWLAYPLSSFVLLGLATVKSIGPLLFTALEGHPLIYNLAEPLRLFTWLTLLSLVFIVSHWLYRHQRWLSDLRDWLSARLAQLLAVNQSLERPDVMLLFLLGCIGWAAFTLLEPGSSEEPLVVKLAEGFTPLSSVIVVLVCRPLIQRRWRAPQVVDLQLLAGGLITLLVISFAVNSRSVFAVPLLSLLLALLFEALFGLLRVRRRTLLAFGLAVVVGMPFLTDLATTIVLTRDYRSSVNAAELVSMTLDQMGRRDELAERRQADREAGFNDWDEVYLDNVFLARFCNLKFDDNALSLEHRLSSTGRDLMRLYYLERLYATAPRYILDLFGIDNDEKLTINDRSFGDELYALSTGEKSARGGFRTGHLIGSDLAVFGVWSLPLLALVLLPLFAMVDALQARPRGEPLLNPLVITQLVPLLTLSNAESLITLVQFMLRGLPQIVLTYALAAWLGRRLLSPAWA